MKVYVLQRTWCDEYEGHSKIEGVFTNKQLADSRLLFCNERNTHEDLSYSLVEYNTQD